MDWIETPGSSNIARFKFDETSEVLTVAFKNGTTYNYFNVPENLFSAMQSARSKGWFLAQHVKGRYRYTRT